MGIHKTTKKTLEVMVCSNHECETWYRIGTHFFHTCPNCRVPMIKSLKEIEMKKIG